MNVKLLLALFALTVAQGCAQYTTRFHTAGTPENEPHQRRTTADAFGGADTFDLGKQCADGWAELTFEARTGKGMTETWRCQTPQRTAVSSPTSSPSE